MHSALVSDKEVRHSKMANAYGRTMFQLAKIVLVLQSQALKGCFFRKVEVGPKKQLVSTS